MFERANISLKTVQISSSRRNEFFEFMLEFRNEFAEFWLEYFEYSNFYRVSVSQNYKSLNSNFMEYV